MFLNSTINERRKFNNMHSEDDVSNKNTRRRLSASSQKSISWIKSFAKSDPRWKIMRFFQNFVVEYDAKNFPEFVFFEGLKHELKGEISRIRPRVFSVWRTTNMDAIRMMMTGKGTGKGLDIKGKSAIRGKLSGFVPFVQIHNKDEDKKKVGTCPSNTRVRIFFASKSSRDEACVHLKRIMLEMIKELKIAKESISVPGIDSEEYEVALQKMIWKMTNPRVIKVDDYAPKTFGVDIPERLLWEAYIIRGDCTRVKGSEMDTGRPSEPQFFFMNLHATRNAKSTPRAVVFQNDEENPMDPMSLLMAYEENGNVVPVVSDFDPFLIGTRGIPYKEPITTDQLIILQWCVNEIEGILKSPKINGGWTKRWLRVLKKATVRGFIPHPPRYGFGDPMSYSIVENTVGSLQSSGAVRHGSECFNYYFPQAMDEEYLIIYPEYFGDLPYKYVNQHELRQFLISQVDLGFTFPLHPKWVLCDPGWIQVWKVLLSSNLPYVQESLNVWYPPESGIREKINEIFMSFPSGFTEADDGMSTCITSTEETDLALLELKRYMTLQRAKKKLRVVTHWMNITRNFVVERSNDELKHKALKWKEGHDQNCDTSPQALWVRKLSEKKKQIIRIENEMRGLQKNIEEKKSTKDPHFCVKIIQDIKRRENELDAKEACIKARESNLEQLELRFKLRLEQINDRNDKRKSKKVLEIRRKEVELVRKENYLRAVEEKLTAQEKQVGIKEAILRIKLELREKNI